MRRAKKFWLGTGLALIAAAGLAVGTGILLLRSAWFHEKVRARIVREVEQATGGRAEIGSFSFDWSSMRAGVRRFVLHGLEGPGEPPLFEARNVEVGLKIVSAFRRDVDIRLLRIREPAIHIVVYPDGSTNLPQPAAARRSLADSIQRILGLAIDQFRVENGLLSLNSRRIPLELDGRGLRARLFYEAAGPRYTGKVSFENLRVKSPVAVPLDFGVEAALSVTGSEIAIEAARLVRGNSVIRAGGAVRNLSAPRSEFRFDATLALQELRELFRFPGEIRGSAEVSGSFLFAGAGEYQLDGRLTANGLALGYRGRRLTGVRVSSQLQLAPGGLALDDLRLSALGGAFAGKAVVGDHWRFTVVEGELRDISAEHLSRLADVRLASVRGRLSGPVTLRARLDRPFPRIVQARSRLALVAEAGPLPLQGSLDIGYDQAAGTLELGNSYLTTPSSRVQFQGTLGRSLRVSLNSQKPEEFLPLVSVLRPTAPQSVPISFDGGSARFEGLVTGPIADPHLRGRVSLTSFRIRGHRFDRFDGDISASASEAHAHSFSLESEGMLLEGEARAGLEDWQASAGSALAGSFTVRHVKLGPVLAEAGWQMPLEGIVSGRLSVAGTFRAPDVKGRLQVLSPVIHGRRFDSVEVEARYAGGTLDVASIELRAAQATLAARGAFVAQSGDWRNGSLRFEVSGQGLALSQLGGPDRFPGAEARIDFQSRGEASVRSAALQLVALAGELHARDIRINGKPVGKLNCVAQTDNQSLLVRAQGEMAGATLSGRSTWRLDARNAVEGELRWTKLPLSSLGPWLAPGGARLPLQGFADGRISFSGQGADLAGWKARVEIAGLSLEPETAEAPPGVLRFSNDGPILLDIDRGAVRINRAVLKGPDTNLEASGAVALGVGNSMQFRLRGLVNLAVLRNFNPDLTASGSSTLDATVRGRLANPEIFGRLEFKNGSFYLSDLPNGIDKATGTILFSRDRATIEKLTAETGGGKLTFGGFVGFGGGQIVYRLQAEAAQVRIRYPEGVSTTLDASLSLTGTSANSTLSGNVTILRTTVSPQVDLVGTLARSSKPLVTPGTQNRLLRGMRFDVHVESSPNARLDTTLTRDLQVEAGFQLRGSPYKPVLLGRLSVTQGEVSFLGTRYTINRGEVSFLNPVKLEPVVNMDLATRVMGTEVTITFAGPLDRLNVTYRSDPPLQPAEIIALLAVGRAPSTDPTVTARQAELDQVSLGQIGATTVIGEALAAPVTGRLQRFFGVSRIRIDPRLTGVENNPQTQLTLEQQVSRNVTFTYITNLSRGQEQIVRVEWNINRRWSLVAVRDENGLFGIDVLFRKQFR